MSVGDSVGEKTITDLHQYVMAWLTRLEELLGAPSLQAFLDRNQIEISIRVTRKDPQ
jgi:hypothetical protein